MEILTFKATKQLIDDLNNESEKVAIESRSNFIRLLLIASLREVKRSGFHDFISNSTQLKKS